MKREIKFRGLKEDSNTWIYGSLAYMFDRPEHTCIMTKCYFSTRDFMEEELAEGFALGEFIPVDYNTVGQFTGLLDKKLAEIYEGDKVSALFNTTKHGNIVVQGEIKMIDYMWCLDCGDDDIYSINRLHDFELIGNIYSDNLDIK